MNLLIDIKNISKILGILDNDEKIMLMEYLDKIE